MRTAAESGKRKRLFALTVLAIALMGVANAQAYWTASGAGAGSGNAGTLDAPTLSGTPGAGTTTLSWSAVSPPGSGTVSYYVTRGSGNPGGNCPTSAAPTAVLTCMDSGLSAGTYSYTVTAVWRTWTATSSPATQVIVSTGAASKLSFTQSPGNTTAGVAFATQPQVTVQDQAGRTVTTDSSNVTIAVTGGTPSVTCTANPKAASSGVVTFAGCAITKAGTSYTLTATDGSLTSAVSSPSFTITAATAVGYSLTAVAAVMVKEGLLTAEVSDPSVAVSV